MSAPRLLRQLQREVKAHPKRAALLAVLTGVGIYFWAPLIAGWIAPQPPTAANTKPAAAKSAVGSPGTSAATGSPTPNSLADAGAVPWKPVWEAIRQDRRTQPSSTLAATADPFRPFFEPDEAADAEQNTVVASSATSEPTDSPSGERTATTVDPTPRSLGMKLTGTIVGPRHRAAVIDGKIVAVGELVASGTPPKPGTEFRLAGVEPQSAVLQRNGKTYKLVIEPPNVAGTNIAVLAPPTPN